MSQILNLENLFAYSLIILIHFLIPASLLEPIKKVSEVTTIVVAERI